MPARTTSISLNLELRRTAAKELFNHVWTLLEKEDRSARETDLMIDAAHASRFFWEEIGAPVNHARGEWQISRVYATVGRVEPAIYHAERCLEICENSELGDFDLAYAYEALARAQAIARDSNAAAHYEQKARDLAERITTPADHDLVLSDLNALPR